VHSKDDDIEKHCGALARKGGRSELLYPNVQSTKSNSKQMCFSVSFCLFHINFRVLRDGGLPLRLLM
jgi:hypothetical protein